MPIPTDKKPQRPVKGDDQIIGRAFNYSILFIGVILLLVGSIFFLNRDPQQTTVSDSAPAAPALSENMLAAPAEPLPTRPQFINITKASGIDFMHINGAQGDRMLPETMGGGVTFFDYDQDDDQDILLINSNRWPWDSEQDPEHNSLKLYANNGNGQFTVVTDSGLVSQAYAMGATVGDIDNDADLDVYITAVGSNQLFRNDGPEGFVEITEQAGLNGADDWSTGAAFVDVDNDQDMDLVVVNYVTWSREIDLKANYQLVGIGRAYGPPATFSGSQPQLWINDGHGVFIDESKKRGFNIENSATGVLVAKSLAVLPVDLDQDGDLDLFVSNDTTRNFALLNDGHGVFTEQGQLLGLAFDNMGRSTGAMGVDVSWQAGQTAPVIAVGNFANEMTSMFAMDPNTGNYSDDAVLLGIGGSSRQALTFGLFFFDYDLDGNNDLFQVNGHVENEINRVQPSQQHAQPPQLFWHCGVDCRRQYIALSPDELGPLGEPLVGRSAAYADIDADGDLDILVGQTGGPAQLFRNNTEHGHWIRLTVTSNSGNRFAMGCTITQSQNGQSSIRLIHPSRSYLSQIELTQTFGLGDQQSAGKITVSCPDGRQKTLTDLAINQHHRLTLP